jgi:hypothetical protein
MARTAPKKKYLVRVEGIAPIIAEYEVWAENEEDAARLLDTQPHLQKLRDRPNIDLPRMRKFRLSVKDLMTGMIGLRKSF